MGVNAANNSGHDTHFLHSEQQLPSHSGLVQVKFPGSVIDSWNQWL